MSQERKQALSTEDTCVLQSQALTSIADAQSTLTIALGCLEATRSDRWSGTIEKLEEARAALGIALAMGRRTDLDLEPELNVACGFAFAMGQGMPPMEDKVTP
jgi:hypothetical protein